MDYSEDNDFVVQSYYYGHISSNTPPNKSVPVKLVNTMDQISNGQFEIPEGCYGTSFLVPIPKYSDGEIISHSKTGLFVHEKDFFSKKRIQEEFRDRKDLHELMDENSLSYLIRDGDNFLTGPHSLDEIYVVRGEPYNYKQILEIKIEGKELETKSDVRDLFMNYCKTLTDKKRADFEEKYGKISPH